MKFYYFVDKEGVRQGPLPLDDLSAYDISPTTLVWTKGMKKWMKAKDVSDFHSILLRSQDANDIDSAIVSSTETTENNSNASLAPSENDNIDEATVEESVEKDVKKAFWGKAHKKSIIMVSVFVLVCIGVIIFFFQKNKLDEEYEFEEQAFEERVGEKTDSKQNHLTSSVVAEDYAYDDESSRDIDWYSDILSVRELDNSDIQNLSKDEMRLLRNEIFARHGYIFKSENLASHFAQFSWYYPKSSNVYNELSKIEKYNVDFLKKYEK